MAGEMQDLIAVESAPATLTVNYETLRTAIAERLKDYDVVVSPDGVKEAKKDAAEINKLAQEIDRCRKDKVAEVSVPIREFDDQMKVLVRDCKDARQKIMDQVQQYEDQVREQVREMLEAERQTFWIEIGVEEEFRRAGYEDLILLSSMTGSGGLTAKARSTLEARVREDRATQDKVRMRLLELENASYRAGLASPLTRDHVHRFLEADDETYSAELERLLAAEVERQRAAETRMREQIEREQAARPAPEPAHAEAEEGPGGVDPDSVPDIEAPDGKDAVRVTCAFDITVKTHVTDDDIVAELRRVIAKAGITSLASVKVHRTSREAA